MSTTDEKMATIHLPHGSRPSKVCARGDCEECGGTGWRWRQVFSAGEFAFGDYRVPFDTTQPFIRHAWVLEDVEVLPEPVAFKGSQGTFFVAPEMVGLPPEPAPVEAQGVLL